MLRVSLLGVLGPHDLLNGARALLAEMQWLWYPALGKFLRMSSAASPVGQNDSDFWGSISAVGITFI